MTQEPETLPHLTAVMALLRDELPHNLGAELGVAPVDGPPYAVIYPDTGNVGWARLCMTRTEIVVRFWVHAIGLMPEQAMWAMDKVRNALDGTRLPVDGYRTQAITQTLGPQPMTRDLTVQPPVFLQVAEFSIRSQRSAVA